MPNFAIESFHWEALSLFNLHSDEKKKRFKYFFIIILFYIYNGQSNKIKKTY